MPPPQARRGRRASVTDLASNTTDADFHVVEVNKSGAIIRHFTHPEHCAKILGGPNDLVTQREIKAACDAELLGIKSDILGRRVAWATKYVEPEDAEVDEDQQDEAMKERLRKMQESQNRVRMTEPEPEPEVELVYNPDETLQDIRADIAAAAIEIKRLRQELERIESGAGMSDGNVDLQIDQEIEELTDQQNKIHNLDASLDAQLREMGREQALTNSQLKQSKEVIREKDVELKKLRTALRELERRTASEVFRGRELELEIQVVRSRRQAAAKTIKQLEAKIVISKDTAQTAREDAVAERKLVATNRQALEEARLGLAAKDKDDAVLEEARLSKELAEEKQRRVAVRQETKDTRKQLVRKERELMAKEAELATKLRQANLAQHTADGKFLEAQQLFDHSNLVLAAQSRRMSELSRRRESAERKLAGSSPRREAGNQQKPSGPQARIPAASGVDVSIGEDSSHSSAMTQPSFSIISPGAGKTPQLPPTPQTPLRAGLNVLVRQRGETASGTDGNAVEDTIREGRVTQVSPTRERCSVVFSDGEVAHEIPIELIERQRQEWELMPKLQQRFTSEKTLNQKVADKRRKARERKVQLAGSGAAAAQATLIKHAPSLSFLRVLSTTERMQYFHQEEADEGGGAVAK